MLLSYFTLDCSANIDTDNIEDILPHSAIHEILIEAVNVRPPMAVTYKITLFFKEPLPESELQKIMEEFRDRLVSIVCLVTQVDACASDEITIEDNDKTCTVVSRVDTKVPQKRRDITIVALNKENLSKISEEEWNALKRFKKAFISIPLSEQFEATVGAIDILGKKKYGGGVGERIRSFTCKDLGMDKDFGKIIDNERSFKIHENKLDKIDINSIDRIKEATRDYFGQLLGMKLRKDLIKMGDTFKIIYSRENKNSK
ncbi:MAG: hypothetical protein HYT10_02735 [Candidatus Levybacteria bacterium]|nr:hypothetical protein [Candidatus Levybacteria bacterium]